MSGENSEEEILQIIYEEVLDQFKGNFRTFQTLRERLGQIIAFNGVILNLELIGILQIFSTKIAVNYLEILVLSSIFIIISLIIATYAYTSAPLKTLKSTEYMKKKYSDKKKLLKAICDERKQNMEGNKKILHKRATFTHVSLYTLVLSVSLVAVFIMLNITNLFYILIFAIIAIIISFIIYNKVNKDLEEKLGLNESAEITNT